MTDEKYRDEGLQTSLFQQGLRTLVVYSIDIDSMIIKRR